MATTLMATEPVQGVRKNQQQFLRGYVTWLG